MAVDPQTVIMLPAYRVGFTPPAPNSLGAGELFVQLLPTPRLWVGTIADAGFAGDLVCFVGAPAVLPPINTNVPYLSRADDLLTCTMGTWTGEPHTYLWQWQRDAVDLGEASAADTYTVTADDTGHVITCVVTAANDEGATASPPSNGITV